MDIKRGLIPETVGRGFAVAYDTGRDQSDTESTWAGKDDGTIHLECDIVHSYITNLSPRSDIRVQFFSPE